MNVHTSFSRPNNLIGDTEEMDLKPKTEYGLLFQSTIFALARTLPQTRTSDLTKFYRSQCKIQQEIV